MKLSDLLDILDPLSDICVWYDDMMTDEDEPQYSGVAMDCPYWLASAYIYKGLEDNDCALSVRTSENDDRKVGLLVVSVTSEKEKAI